MAIKNQKLLITVTIFSLAIIVILSAIYFLKSAKEVPCNQRAELGLELCVNPQGISAIQKYNIQ